LVAPGLLLSRIAGAKSARAAVARILRPLLKLLPARFSRRRALDFSEELSIVTDAWTWSRDPETQVQFIRKCLRNGLWVEWWRTADGWELRVTKPEIRPTTSATWL